MHGAATGRPRVTALVVGLCIAAAVSSCQVVSPSAGSSRTVLSAPGASVPPLVLPSGERATLGEADQGTTVNVRVGAVVTVQLGVDVGERWSQPSSSSAGVLVQTAASQSPDGSAAGTFTALMPGTSTLTATADPVCRPACGRLSRLWRVTVVVTPHPVP